MISFKEYYSFIDVCWIIGFSIILDTLLLALIIILVNWFM